MSRTPVRKKRRTVGHLDLSSCRLSRIFAIRLAAEVSAENVDGILTHPPVAPPSETAPAAHCLPVMLTAEP
jgi:hypothetical protein